MHSHMQIGEDEPQQEYQLQPFYLGPNFISWTSKKQHIAVRLSGEAECRALALTADEDVKPSISSR